MLRKVSILLLEAARRLQREQRKHMRAHSFGVHYHAIKPPATASRNNLSSEINVPELNDIIKHQHV